MRFTTGVTLTFTPFSLHGEAQQALLDINTQVVQSQQVGSLPYEISWPGSMASGSVNLSFTPQIPGRQSPVNFDGPWALMRTRRAALLSVWLQPRRFALRKACTGESGRMR